MLIGWAAESARAKYKTNSNVQYCIAGSRDRTSVVLTTPGDKKHWVVFYHRSPPRFEAGFEEGNYKNSLKFPASDEGTGFFPSLLEEKTRVVRVSATSETVLHLSYLICLLAGAGIVIRK
jgi:hypothetical protein